MIALLSTVLILLKKVLKDFNVTQHINFPTHIEGHTLEIVATIGDSSIFNIERTENDISHHHLITFQLGRGSVKKVDKQIS